jgi:hypothetical protein
MGASQASVWTLAASASRQDIPQASGAAFDDVRTDRACSIVDRDLLSGGGLAHDGKKSSKYVRDPIRRTRRGQPAGKLRR